MLPSLGLTDYQNMLEMDLLFVRRGWDRFRGGLVLRYSDGCQDWENQ